MPDDEKTKLRLEIAHVLFIDVVGYSKLLIDEQAEAVHELNQIVRNTETARKAETAGQLIILPTGDGMALVFTGSVEDPVECALQISQALCVQPSVPVRMGIHSGPVHHVADVNQRANIAGAGINIAERVMDCGDAGHILLSKRVADDLAQYRRWQPYLHDLGAIKVKHGERVSVVNLYRDAAGNPAVPERFKTAQSWLARRSKRVTYALGIPIGIAVFATAVALAIFFLRIRSGNKVAIANPTQSKESSTTLIPAKSIAVLPFENRSDDRNAAYFADGIQDEILTKLGSIADLKVISRTSTAKYKSAPEDLKIVSQQLGVATILEGSVQKAADKVRVNVQLIDAHADSQLWAKSYDREAKDVFAVESEVAQEVADSLQAKLSPAETNRLGVAPTNDPAAYDLFLKGEYEFRRAQSSLAAESFDEAAGWYSQAITRDAGFALAMARLAECRMLRHWFIEKLSEAELTGVRRIAERALALAPDLAPAHLALGAWYYYGHREYGEALAEFARALQLQPNNANALEYSCYVERRQGQWQRCLDGLRKCIERDPRNASLIANLSETYCHLRMWKEAEETARRAIAIDPLEANGAGSLLDSIVNGTGDIQKAERLLVTLPGDNKVVTNALDVRGVTGHRAYTFVLARDFESALGVWRNAGNSAADERRRLSAIVAIRVLRNDFAGVEVDAANALHLLEERLRQRPDEILTLTELSWSYLALRNDGDALRVARQAAELLPLEKDAIAGTFTLAALAGLEARTGAIADAVTILRRLLSIPAGESVSIARLKIDPVWDPIRSAPAFQQLLAEGEHVGP
jgi:TolB-like protein/class 3 adenylate cyclase